MLRSALFRLKPFTRFAGTTSGSTPNKKYPDLPKDDEGFIHDLNPFSRPILRKGYVSPTSGTVIDFVQADKDKDVEMIEEIWLKGFRDTSNVCYHLGLTYHQLHDLLAHWVTEMLNNGDVVLVFDKTKVIGLQLMQYHYEKEFEELFGGELPGHPNPKFIVKNDYAADIDKFPFPRKMSQLACFLSDLVRQTGKFLPAECKSYAAFEATYVHKNYQKDRIGTALVDIAIEASLRRNVIHGVGYCVATGTRRIGLATGWSPMFEAFFKDYKDNGKQVFYDLNGL